MSKIKMSFKRTFLPSVVAAMAVILLSYSFRYFGIFGQLAILIAAPPVYAGFYGYLFKRIDGESPVISSLFDYCRGVGKFFKSLVMVGLGSLVAEILSLYVSIFCVSRNINFFEDSAITVNFVSSALAKVCSLFFLFMPYLYVKNLNIGVGAALKKSARLVLKYLLVFIAIKAAAMLPNIIYTIAVFNTAPDFAILYSAFLPINILTKAFSIWAEFTAVYCIFERERDSMLKDFFNKFKKDIDTSDETAEDTPFIEPYDFCIEADERFHDEKIIETENIRGVDILAALEEMDLAFDVVNHFGIRRKLKRMFDDLSFEIDEFVTYEGGRSIENSFTEEIDEREFEVSAEISKASDYEPFKLILRVDVSEEE